MEPDFEKYTLEELQEVEQSIDRSQYPKRYLKIRKLIDIRAKDYEELPTTSINFISLKDIFLYFKTCAVTRLYCLAFSIVLYFMLIDLNPESIYRGNLFITLLLSVGGIFYPWDPDDKET